MARLAYTLLWYLATPLVLLRLVWRARRQRGYVAHVAERFGQYGAVPAPQTWLWLHAVSVGETRAAEPLVRALQARHPQHRILLTHMTPTGREAGAALFGDGVTQVYLPYDYPGAVARFLDHFRPVAGVIMETEIWPNLVQAAAARGLPLYLVNARLSARSMAGYRRAGALAHDALAAFTAIAAQSAADAGRLQALGARQVTVTGNLKFDLAVPATQRSQGEAWRAAVGPRPVVLAASTREGEEALLSAALRHAAGPALWVIVPRHPQRFDAVAALLAAAGLRVQRRSAGLDIAPGTQVLLGDSMGEMPAYYAMSDVVLMGGSFLDFGAHNLIEPCALAKPVIVGPSTYNFAEVAAAAVAAGAALSAATVDDAAALALQLLADPQRCAQMGAAGVAFTAAHRGATQRVLAMVTLEDR